jgi:hypothetical protein
LKDIEFNNYDDYDDTCDLNPNKICDNCEKCLEIDGVDYEEVIIEGFLEDESEVEEYLTENWIEKSSIENGCSEEENYEYEYIEDIPELKKQYDEMLDEIFGRANHSHKCEDGECDCHHNH